ncbi:LicD family protein, partial [Haemophilus influenzae]
MRHYPTKPDL